ncbi:MAG: DUF560 domain-containing protein [Alphaproteobacteria bacterium]|nr:DUF560 domain-containing protein [Alphaproteobacteria bacterium]
MKRLPLSALSVRSGRILSVCRALCVTAALAASLPAYANDGITLKQYRRWLETSSNVTLDSYFTYAQRAMKDRNYYEAEWALRKLLSNSGGELDRVKLDLSLALLAQGKFLDARDYLEEVLRKNPPPQVQQNIRALLAQVGKQLSPHRITGNLTVGFNSDTNGNSAPGSGQVSIIDTSVTLDPSAQETDDINYFTALSVNHTYRHDTQNRTKTIRWKTDLVGYLSRQDKLDQLDVSLFSARTGPEVTWLNTGVRAGLFASHSVVSLDGKGYLRNPKGEFVLDIPINTRLTASSNTSLEYREFLNSETVTIYEDRNGRAWQQTFGLRYAFNDKWAVDGNLFYRSEGARQNYYSNHQYGGGVGLTHLFTKSLMMNTRLGYRYFDYDAADFLISNKVREDRESSFGVTLAKSFTIDGYETKPSATLGYVYRDMQSNIQNYDYDNHRVTTALNLPF